MARNVIEVVIEGKDKASVVLSGFGGNLQAIGQIATGAAAAAVGAVGAIGAGIAKLAIDAAPLEGIESAFGALAERIGTSSEEMLASMEEASAGMIAQRDIMKSVNLAAALVGDSFAEEMPRAMEALTKAAAATGEDMDYMMDSLVRGVGRVSPLILDNLGVQMDMNKALEDYAKEHGIAAVKTTVDHSGAIADLNEKLGFQQREMENLEAAYHAANAEFIHAQEIWPAGSNELGKFQARVEKAQLAIDKKAASIADTNKQLGKLQAEHGTTAESAADLTKVLTKEQQQMALLDQVVGKLEDKYADMPPVTDSLATSVAAMQAKFQNFKDQAGKAFIPVVGEIMSKLAELADRVMPLVTGFIEDPFVPFLEKLAAAFGFVFDEVMSGQFDFEAFREVLGTLLPQEIVDRIYSLAYSVLNLVETVRPYIEMAVEWIIQNVAVQDALIALGIAIGTFLVPLIVGLVSPLLSLIATFAALSVAIAFLRKAWETDWMGIKTTLTEFWENTARPALERLGQWLSVNIPVAMQILSDFWTNTLQPAFAQLADWLQVNVPIAVQILSDFWNNVLLPALQAAWTFIQESILPIFAQLGIWLQENIPLAVETLVIFWNEWLLPALQAVWAFIQEYLIPLFLALANLMDAVVGLAVTVLAGLWENVLWPALEKVWLFIQDNIIPIFESLTKKTEERLGPKLEWLQKEILEPLYKIFEKVKSIIEKIIDKINAMADAIRNVDLGPFSPGSLSPFELSLQGIADTIKGKTIPAIRNLSNAVGGLGGIGGEFAFGATGVNYGMAPVGNQYATTTNLTMNVFTRATTPSVIQDFDTMRALA